METVKAFIDSENFDMVISTFDIAEVYDTYVWVCNENGHKPLTSKTFATFMKRHGYLVKTKMRTGVTRRRWVNRENV